MLAPQCVSFFKLNATNPRMNQLPKPRPRPQPMKPYTRIWGIYVAWVLGCGISIFRLGAVAMGLHWFPNKAPVNEAQYCSRVAWMFCKSMQYLWHRHHKRGVWKRHSCPPQLADPIPEGPRPRHSPYTLHLPMKHSLVLNVSSYICTLSR